jgi:hypothetical protein
MVSEADRMMRVVRDPVGWDNADEAAVGGNCAVHCLVDAVGFCRASSVAGDAATAAGVSGADSTGTASAAAPPIRPVATETSCRGRGRDMSETETARSATAAVA